MLATLTKVSCTPASLFSRQLLLGRAMHAGKDAAQPNFTLCKPARSLATHKEKLPVSPKDSAKKPRKRQTAAESWAEEEALLSKMDPEAAKLARHYLYLDPPWVIAPPRLSFDPGLDMRKLRKPKTKRDKQERELCRAWRKVEGEARLKRLQEEVADLAKRRREEELQEIVWLAKEIGRVEARTELGWMALQAGEEDELVEDES